MTTFQESDHKDNCDVPLVATTRLEGMPEFPYSHALKEKIHEII